MFGGGAVVCPGQYFAITEILTLSAVMVLQFEMEPLQEHWPALTAHHSNPGISFQQPDQDVEVEMTPRNEGKLEISVLQSDDVVGPSSIGYLAETDG
ncbi:hypothetical protein F4679DRAFT_565633 [Xylaria curta]|nr:hypothetical protein F4679DRAFT_565633 [Xylaria curta]